MQMQKQQVSALVFGGSGPKPAKPNKGRELQKDESEGVLFAFETLDAERTGFVSRRHLKVALRALGFNVKKADVADLLARHGEEETEQLDFQTFRKVVADLLSQRTLQDEHRRAFQLFDITGQGAIDLPTLKRVVRSLNLEIGDEELQDMITEFGKDGYIGEQDWMAIMNAD